MTNNGTIDDRYFEWLYGQVGAITNRNPSRSYWELARQLYETPFIWTVPNDDNREGDGKELRIEFIYEKLLDELDPIWMDLDCSMLEMLIGLARRTAFEADGDVGEWFWIFLQNLDLRGYTDEVYDQDVSDIVDRILDRVNERSYRRNGAGGLFPLRNAEKDQRKVELWYQMSAYLLENEDYGM